MGKQDPDRLLDSGARKAQRLRQLLYVVVLVALALAVYVLQTGQGPVLTAVFALALVALGALLGPELSVAQAWIRRRVVGARSSAVADVLSAREVHSLVERMSGRSTNGAFAPDSEALTELDAALTDIAKGSEASHVVIIVGKGPVATNRVTARALARVDPAADTFQYLQPHDTSTFAEWLKGAPELELPRGLDRTKPALLLLQNFERYWEQGVRAEHFAQWQPDRPAVLAWSAQEGGATPSWLNPFYGSACVVDARTSAEDEP